MGLEKGTGSMGRGGWRRMEDFAWSLEDRRPC